MTYESAGRPDRFGGSVRYPSDAHGIGRFRPLAWTPTPETRTEIVTPATDQPTMLPFHPTAGKLSSSRRVTRNRSGRSRQSRSELRRDRWNSRTTSLALHAFGLFLPGRERFRNPAKGGVQGARTQESVYASPYWEPPGDQAAQEREVGHRAKSAWHGQGVPDREGSVGDVMRWAQADQPDVSGHAIEQHDHICVFNRGDQDSVQMRLDPV